MFKVFPWIFRMKTRTNLYFLRNDCEAGARQMHSDLCYFLGLSPVNWKWYLPSVNLPSPHGGPGAIHLLVSAGTHQSIWRLTYCLVPGWFGNTGHLGSVCKWCDSSCGMPRDWQTLAVLTSGKEEHGKQKGDVFMYHAAMTWLFCKRTHCFLAFATVNRYNRRETVLLFF